MNALLRDIRVGFRSLIKHSGFSVMAVLTLALGLGATTAIFSFVNARLLRSLPFKDSDRLIALKEINLEKRRDIGTASPRNLEEWQKQSQTIERFGAWRDWHFRVATGNGPVIASSAISSPELFQVLGIKPLRGRFPIREENEVGRDHVIVITNSFWQKQFGGAETVVGQILLLDKEPFTIVGVLPPEFEALDLGSNEIWAPLSVDPDQFLERRDLRNRRVYARLKQGVSIEEAQAEMNTIAGRLAQQYPSENAGWNVRINTLQREEIGDLRPTLLLFLGAVGMVLLIACINVSNLLLARAMARRKEFAVRVALGAGRLQLVRQLLSESVLLSVIGGTAGLFLATWLIRLFISISPATLSHPETIKLDSVVLAFTFGLSLITGILFGLVPGIKASQVNLVSELKDAPGSFRLRRALRLRSVLVVSQVALALTLLIGAGLLGQTFLRLLKHDPGFNTENLLTASVFPPTDKYKTRQQLVGLSDRITDEIKSVPGVTSVGSSSSGPQFGGFEPMDVLPEGEGANNGQYPQAVYFNTSPNFFATMEIPFLAGRDFSRADTFDSPQVAIINAHMARRFWPNQSAVGQRLTLVRSKQAVEVIGVVGDIKRYGLGEVVQPEIYFPFSQQPRGATFFVIRSNITPDALREDVKSRIAAIDPEIRLSRTSSMDQLISSSLKRPRFNLLLLGMFAITALLLACVGIYGVTSYLVEQQTKEIGIRTALGARRSQIFALVIGRSVRLSVIGIAIGLVASFVLMRFLSDLLYGVAVIDPITFGSISILLLGVAALACFIPARRATKVDPLVALRYE